MYSLCFIFSLTPSFISKKIGVALQVFYDVVTEGRIKETEFEWLTAWTMSVSALLLSQARPQSAKYLHGVFAVTDGARVNVSPPYDHRKQSLFFHGPVQQGYAVNCFVWNSYMQQLPFQDNGIIQSLRVYPVCVGRAFRMK